VNTNNPRKLWWHINRYHFQTGALLLSFVAAVALLLWGAVELCKTRQFDVTLGDGTKATCITVGCAPNAAVSCVPLVEPVPKEGEP
jgi:hypothetical protein